MKIKHCILFIVLGLVISTCKKFPEDPFISLRTVKMRLKTEWKLNKIIVNGTDYTQSYNDSLINEDFTSMKFDVNTNDVGLSDYIGVINTENKTSFVNYFNLNKNKTLFFRQWAFNSGPNYTYDGTNLKHINNVLGLGTYKILKLYNKHFIIETNYNSNTYEIQYKK